VQDTLRGLVHKLEQTDFQKLINSVTQARIGLNQLVSSHDVMSVLNSLERDMPEFREAILDFRRLTDTANRSVANVSADFHDVSADLRQT
jgi:hypothetical protein